jgi:hypothetical protein
MTRAFFLTCALEFRLSDEFNLEALGDDWDIDTGTGGNDYDVEIFIDDDKTPFQELLRIVRERVARLPGEWSPVQYMGTFDEDWNLVEEQMCGRGVRSQRRWDRSCSHRRA